MGYDPPRTDIGWIRDRFARIDGQIRELQKPGSGQINKQLETLMNLVNNLQEEIENVSASGATWQGPVLTSGTIRTSGQLRGDDGVRSVGVYNNLLTSGYRVQYVDSNGFMGYVPSSRRFKSDIEAAPDVKAAALALEVVTFRYDQAIAQFGDAARVEWGVIAEDLHELGLTWAVDYDEDGEPFGVKYERLVLAVFPVIQDHEARLSAAGL